MKIRVSDRDIVESKRVEPTDIPLAYVDSQDATFNVDFHLSKDFATDSSKKVYAYQKFSSIPYVFDSKGKKLAGKFKRSGNIYSYEPSNATEFQPETFKCSVLIKKMMKYKSSTSYDITVGVIDEDYDHQFTNKLIGIFGDANKRGICPSNITVNQGSIDYTDFLSKSSDTKADFLFAKSDGGVVSGVLKKLIESAHINLWLQVDSFGDMLEKADSKKFYNFTKEGSYGDFYVPSERKNAPKKIFKQSGENLGYPKKDYKYEFPYEDVLVLHKPNTGYIIITPKEFMDNAVDNVKIIYDVLITVFLNSYRTSRYATSWITDNPVDYVSYSGERLDAYHKTINITKLLYFKGYQLDGEYQLLSVNTDKKDVSFISVDANKNILFRKNGKGQKDPVKNDGISSYLTTKGTVMYYRPEDVNLVTSRANLSADIQPGLITVKLMPLKDSSRKIYMKKAKTFKITDANKHWCLTINSELDPQLIEREQYRQSVHGYKIADIIITAKDKSSLIDIRPYGGGLPVDEKDVYSLLDIGNVKGRPYRLGSTIIIRLPKRLEEHREKIKDAIDRHIAAGQHYALLFGEKEVN